MTSDHRSNKAFQLTHYDSSSAPVRGAASSAMPFGITSLLKGGISPAKLTSQLSGTKSHSSPASGHPQIIAHRGWSHEYPENTGVAFDAALTLPLLGGIELDIQFTKDGALVIYHDRTLSKLGLPEKTVSQLTLKELQSLDAGSWFSKTFRNERLLTLNELLKRYAQKTTLYLEIKARNSEEKWNQKMVKAIAECVKKNRSAVTKPQALRVLFLCFSEKILYTVLGQDSSLRCVWNLEKRPAMDTAFFKKISPFFALCFDVQCLTPALVKTLHQKNKKVFTYTCNTKKNLQTALHCGVDAILSNRPDWALQQTLSKNFY